MYGLHITILNLCNEKEQQNMINPQPKTETSNTEATRYRSLTNTTHVDVIPLVDICAPLKYPSF